VRSGKGEGRVGRGGGQAHFVRRESCDAHSSPEPAALLWGGREYGERRAGAQRSQGRVGRGGAHEKGWGDLRFEI